jgi:hypothetical protein
MNTSICPECNKLTPHDSAVAYVNDSGKWTHRSHLIKDAFEISEEDLEKLARRFTRHSIDRARRYD